MNISSKNYPNMFGSLSCALLCLLVASLLHAEPAQTVRNTDLQAQSQSDAQVLAALPINTRLDVLLRRGAWSQVKTNAGQTGWVRMLSLRFDTSGSAADTGSSSNPLSALTSLFSTGRTSNTGTVTTGVKGLGEEDLKNAQENPGEMHKMQKLAVDKKTAKDFAQRSKLTPNHVAYLSTDTKHADNSRSGGN
ncbi:SH3 domain-containing protein [Solimicrobium silvestre]|uniref:Bacterial SH3 domain n=1 Tax=Solimicrobium silvestre TaxID=2099400 RepID=A0A2S9GYD6_9BURK|nr:SH3 domain-containing protein [Solimicrobium silvestre]PRC92718.1 hypothetical protein S2091_2448 [Solimicrobium silvestre]